MRYSAYAKRWAGGWELHVEDVGVTQCRVLESAAQQVADLIGSYTDQTVDPTDVDVVPDLDGLEERVRHAREMTATAEALQREAGIEARAVARALREQGLSVSDSAAVLGVSRGRVSQLVGKS